MDNIRSVIAVASCKGGVGKTTVSVNLALALRRLGHRVGVFDADVYGPNVPVMLGVHRSSDRLPFRMENEKGISLSFIPLYSKEKRKYAEPFVKYGLRIMSLGLMFGESTVVRDPGALGAQMVSALLSDTNWGSLDYLVIDLPPGTGEIVTDVLSAAAPDGVIVVTTPQEMALLDTARSVTLLRTGGHRILGRVENMGHLTCPHCGQRIEMHASDYRRWESVDALPLLGSIPLDPAYGRPVDPYHPLTQLDLSAPAAQVLARLASAVTAALDQAG